MIMHSPPPAAKTPYAIPRSKAAALLEVLGVLVVGHTIAGLVSPLLGVRPLGPLLQAAVESPRPDYVQLSVTVLLALTVQYACLLLLAFGIGLWHHRRPFRRYGLTLAGEPGLKHAGLGLLAFSLFALPVKLLWLANAFLPLGAGLEWWAL